MEDIELNSVDNLETKGGKEIKKKEKKIGYGGKKSPEENSNFLSNLTFSWADGFVIHCFRNVLQLSHLWDLASYDKSEYLAKKIAKSWEIEIQKPKPSYLRAGFRAFGKLHCISLFFYSIYVGSQFVGPEILSRMVTFVVESKLGTSTEDPNMGYYYALIMFGTAMIGSFCNYQANRVTVRTGDRLRSIIVLDVYKKAIKLSNSARSNTSPGQIVNLISNDAQRMIEVFGILNNGLFALPQIIICLALLYEKIGWPTFVGLGLMLAAIPFNGLAAKKLTETRRILIGHTDGRVKVTSEILQAMKIIKLYAWEDSFAKKVLDRRNNEIKLLFSFTRYRTILIAMIGAIPTAASILVFSTYYGYNGSLDAGKIFSALSYLNLLKIPLGFLPILIALGIQMQIASKRVTDFLLLPEMKEVQQIDNPSLPNGVYMKNSTTTWNKEKEDSFGLKNINFEAKGQSLTMVVGSVGSGKSTLVQAMLGELETIDGEIGIKGSIAYVPQQAWIINATLKENIIFGKELDEERYQKVLEVCALKRDIELFPQGDSVEIGERGINLSGGQKQRVSIARAVYSDADVYILDDPLSAVDSHVGKHLFHKCFKGILSSKTVILVANQINYLPFADNTVVLKSGEIVERGTYYELINAKLEFASLLQEYGVDENTKGDDSDDDDDKKDDDKKEEKVEKPKQSDKDGTLISEEEAEQGAVAGKVYWKYVTAGGGLLFLFAMILFLLETGSKTFTDWWLSHWQTESSERMESILLGEEPTGLTDDQNLGIYIGVGMASIIVTVVRTFSFFEYAVRAAHSIHHELFNALLKKPMSFFDQTPLGRIINRFTRDLDIIDNLIATSIAQFFTLMLSVLATLILISIIVPWLLIPLAPICILFFILQYFYRYTSRGLQRIEAITRSPIFNHFSETLNGVVSIRAYKKQQENILKNQKRLDDNNNCYLTLQAMNRWLGLRLDFLGNLIVFFSCIFITLKKDTISPSDVGLVLSYALSITSNLNQGVLQAADTETKMNSVERISQYIRGAVEAPQIIDDCRPSPDWPINGSIKFDNLVMRYREGLDPVLKGITCEIKAKEKIGIVGRTGAGKSSIVLALFRLIEASEGSISIDGENIAKFGLKDLRRNLAIIPQDPVLFSGTLRENLDPFNECPDHELWSILDDIQLSKVFKSTEEGLNSKVTENGENFSVGQRQLIVLARALLRKPKILVLDEATASVDGQSDSLIQATIRNKFSNCTILTIAHRLNTIMDSDKIMVLDAGKISEFDEPWTLLQNQNGLLTWLVNETGPQNAIYLRKLAEAKKSGLNINEITQIDQQNDNLNTPPRL
ncbi:ABC transporter C family protein [Dictyostelium discoideum AX4]|uniref:ABC transporter C family member 12 n=1 Tax=Dictyostelium discoideum TaxID=44689 RepID=ABCCC_DICDI|nr:ABC transporter C family protein [Dictyostelium discoideum AX4]Q54U44.1 RecName: Full=ABC transporter C family member 12; AltName: Full=ABC transporter ABCC.12 [Dictyostelium discoideum]EAL66783.1 ABC transporter C family protein [Dictyostelium discoideum AX4]|eukprot:XP_640932.1 ABC transporter C family protein [Dictyostelium discoideum AX4]